jgi:ribose transport system ATP-binding protein
VAELTLAQRHVVEIARALATRPKVLFFDEPTEPFQQADISKLFELIKALRGRGVAIVYVSHRLHEVVELADRISVMRDGEIIDSRLADAITPVEIVTLIAGRPIGQIFPAKAEKVGDTLLEVRGLSGHGFEKVDMSARAGEIVGLAGVEGEGQREFLRTIAGVARRTAGSIEVRNHRVAGERPAATRRAGIGFVSDDRHAEGLFLSLSVRENIGLGVLDRILRLGVVDTAREIAIGNEVVERFRVRTGSVETAVSDLSGGNQQKVLIGREMAAVDVAARTEIYQRLRTLAQQGVAVVVSSSDGIELEGLCDRVLIFARGHIVRELTGGEVTDATITEANLTAKVSRKAGALGDTGSERWRRMLASDHFPALILAIVTGVIMGGTQIANPYFLSGDNIEEMLTFLAILAFISIGQLLTILVGGIDLSVGALSGLMVVLASFLTPDDASIVQVVGGSVAMLAIATAYGWFQGWLVTEWRLPSIIVTLASFIGLQGLSLAFRPQAAGEISDGISDVFQFPLVGIPIGMILALAVVAAFEWILYRKPAGRRFRAVGSSPAASRRLGIRANRQILLAFVLSGFLTGFGGLMLAGKIGIGSAQTGVDFTIMSITAVVLGGASIGGGRGSLLCTLMGAALVQATSSASSFINSDSSVHYAVLGGVTLLSAIFFSVARRNYRVAA